MPAFASLIAGYRRFRTIGYPAAKARFDALAQDGQAPGIMVISCCDSRVDPSTIFDCGPGELFVLRNVANIVPPFEAGGGQHGVSAAIEFAVCELEVRYLVVMGHGQCGGVAAALKSRDLGAPAPSFIDAWIGLLAPARKRVRHLAVTEAQAAMELEGVRLSLANLRTFPFVAEREATGQLTLHGCWYGISGGQLLLLDPATDTFAPVSA